MVVLFNFFSLCVQAYFEQQEIVLIHCSRVCIFVGAKFYYIGGPWRAYLSYRYNDIVCFTLYFHTPLLLKVGSLYDSLICAHNRKYAWYEVMNL